MSIITSTPLKKTFGDTNHNRVQGPLQWLRKHQGILGDDHMTCYLISYQPIFTLLRIDCPLSWT